MNRIHSACRFLVGLARRAGVLLVSTAGLPAVLWADPPLPPGWSKHPPLPDPERVHAALADGMPGWQITLIVATTALLTAALTVTAYRLRAIRPRVTKSSA